MQRDLSALANREYDVLVVGGGIFGVSAAWDAALRGMSVALVERGDFAQATSANCFKMVHGGIRYLQHGDLPRIRESSQERSVLLRIAPHLVRPVPIAIPTYGHGLQGKEVLRAGVLLYDLLTLDRNRGLGDPQRRIPWGHAISRQECLSLFPGLREKGLTGAVVFHDGQIYSPPRLALAVLRAAVQAGAVAANYVEVERFSQHAGRVVGVQARDTLGGGRLKIRARLAINAAGPWAEPLLRSGLGLQLSRPLAFSRDAYFVVGRQLTKTHGLAVQGSTKDPDALLSRGRRHLFLMPWREHTLVGVWHLVHTGDPDIFAVSTADLRGFLAEINEAHPGLGLTLADVSLCGAGLTLFGENAPDARDLSYGKRSVIIDHAHEHGVAGLVTVVGVRFTTGRGVAEKAIDLACRKLGRRPPASRTAVTPVYGGQVERFAEFARQAVAQRPPGVSPETMAALLQNHGSAYREVLTYVEQDPRLAATLGSSRVLGAEVVHAVREEMAQTLADVVFRRTDLGTAGHPGEPALQACADLMAAQLGWSEGRRQEELAAVRAAFLKGANPEPAAADGESLTTAGGKAWP